MSGISSGSHNFADIISGSGAALNAEIISSTNVSAYETLAVQISGTYSATFTFEGSNDGATWSPLLVQSVSSTSIAPSVTSNANGIYYLPVTSIFFRLKITTYSSGTVDATLMMSENTVNPNIATYLINSPSIDSLDAKITDYSRVSTGTLTALNQTVVLNTIGLSAVAIQLTGTFSANCIVEATVDGSTYVAVNCSTQGGNGTTFTSARGDILLPCGGFTSVRVRASSFSSGTVTATLRGSISSAGAIKIYQDSSTIFFTNSNTRDGSGNSITSQTNGAQRALDVGINVAGVQVDPRLTSDILNIAGTQGTFTVTTTATALNVGGSNLANRKLVTFYFDNSTTVYWGYTVGVTTSTGTPLLRSVPNSFPVGPNVNIYLIVASGTVAGRVTEGS